MRKMDYWIGNPLCFSLSCLHILGRVFPRKKKEPKKVLFLELSEMGSTVLAYAAMSKTKELWPSSELYFMIFKQNQESVKLLEIIPEKNLILIDNSSLFRFKITVFKALIRMKKEGIDTIIDLELFSRVTAIISYLSGASNRVGFYQHTMEGLYRGNMQTHKVSYNPHRHVGVNFLSLVYALKSPDGEWPLTKRHISEKELHIPRISSSKEKLDAIWEKMLSCNPALTKKHILIIINSNAGLLPIRAWPLESYAALCKKILTHHKDVLFVITGVKDAAHDAEVIIETVGEEHCINLVNKTSFRELIDIYNSCHLLITNDSGPVHFAPLTPINIIAFFGPETPKLYGPISDTAVIIDSKFACSPCVSAFNHRKTLCGSNECLKSISVEYVYKIVEEQLENIHHQASHHQKQGTKRQ